MNVNLNDINPYFKNIKDFENLEEMFCVPIAYSTKQFRVIEFLDDRLDNKFIKNFAYLKSPHYLFDFRWKSRIRKSAGNISLVSMLEYLSEKGRNHIINEISNNPLAKEFWRRKLEELEQKIDEPIDSTLPELFQKSQRESKDRYRDTLSKLMLFFIPELIDIC